MDTKALITLLQSHNELEIIDTPLDIYLQIPHLAYIEVKKPHGGKALLFTHAIDSRTNKVFNIPVLMNVFGSQSRLNLIIAQSPESIAKELQDLLHFSPPRGIMDLISMLRRYSTLRFALPKLSRHAPSQKHRILGDAINLYDLPILTTWEHDAAPFITMGQVYTQSLDGTKQNLGMYRLQVHSKNTLGLHWQIHKDSAHFFHEYKAAGVKMPVSIALGGDPLYIWCAQAPLPMGIYELMLYGLIRKRRARVTRCITNDLSVPCDADIIIEGFVDTNVLQDEGPFGDHTGFYTPIEPYPVLEVHAITHKDAPIYPATVVGKPPLEDKYMGYLTERVFLPVIQTSVRGIVDYNMPENGVFHNLILVKIAPTYPGHAKQIMHAFWGVGQMSFVKHAIFVGLDAPDLSNYEELIIYILNRFDTGKILISEGVCDVLDHASLAYAYGGKLALDVSEAEEIPQGYPDKIMQGRILCSNEDLCALLKQHLESTPMPFTLKLVRQYGIQASTQIAIIGIEKHSTEPFLALLDVWAPLAKYMRIAIFVDAHKNDLDNPYMLVWRIVNNIDAKRDVRIIDSQVFIDATDKAESSAHTTRWPKETQCSQDVIDMLIQKGFDIHPTLLHHYQICSSPSTVLNDVSIKTNHT